MTKNLMKGTLIWYGLSWLGSLFGFWKSFPRSWERVDLLVSGFVLLLCAWLLAFSGGDPE